MNGNAKYVQWIIGMLVLIAMAVSGYAVNRLDDKANQSDVNCSLNRIETDIRTIQQDVKELLRR